MLEAPRTLYPHLPILSGQQRYRCDPLLDPPEDARPVHLLRQECPLASACLLFFAGLLSRGVCQAGWVDGPVRHGDDMVAAGLIDESRVYNNPWTPRQDL